MKVLRGRFRNITGQLNSDGVVGIFGFAVLPILETGFTVFVPRNFGFSVLLEFVFL